MNHDEHGRYVAIGMAAIAGSITALALMDWKHMGWQERLLTLFVGAAFAVFAVPPLAAYAGLNVKDLGVICGVTYFGASGWNMFMPVVLQSGARKLREWLGVKEDSQ